MKSFQMLFSRAAKLNASTSTLTTGIGIRSRVLQLSSRRLVHSTPRKDHTTLLSNDKLASFNVLSLKALKNECRNRGLKISGRKGELVDRILAFENTSKSLSGMSKIASSARQLHVTSAAKQKGDSRPVDDVKLPDVAATEDSLQSLDKEYIVHITPLSESADQRPVTMLEKELLASQTASEKPPQVSTTDHDKVIFQADAPEEGFDIVNEEYETANTNHHNLDAANTSGFSKESDSLSSKDKTFFLSVAGLVAGWWSLKLWTNKGDHEH
ncbi:LAFA_0F02278g1_1 [Lachancea sp. 'fantastica']|nr:LAFA_0F02278g1_1 [Lachancea sp. 'fantastica']